MSSYMRLKGFQIRDLVFYLVMYIERDVPVPFAACSEICSFLVRIILGGGFEKGLE